MSNKAQFTQIYAYGDVSNENASLEIVVPRTNSQYIYIEKIYLSVYKAAIGGDGVVKLIDTDGVVIFTINVDGIKDLPLDYGSYGFRIPTANVGLQFVVSGAGTGQASVSVTLKGHLDNK